MDSSPHRINKLLSTIPLDALLGFRIDYIGIAIAF